MNWNAKMESEVNFSILLNLNCNPWETEFWLWYFLFQYLIHGPQENVKLKESFHNHIIFILQDFLAILKAEPIDYIVGIDDILIES